MEETNASEMAGGKGGTKKYIGSCHCGAVRFEVQLEANARISRCNCTICARTAMTGTIVKPSAFTLLSGQSDLSRYEWGAKISQRLFCKTCGVLCFARGHLAQLGGDYVSVNLNCVDEIELSDVDVVYWDGRHNNWQAGPRSTPWPLSARASGE